MDLYSPPQQGALIGLVEQYKHLWDSSDPAHQKRNVVHNSWQEIHEKLRSEHGVELTGPNRSRYCPPEFVDRIVDGQLQPGDWREIVASDNGLRPVTNTGSNNYSVKAETIRNNLAAYFRTPEGSVPWQDDMVQQGRKRKIANP